jgi:hypothetical protein
MALHNTYVILSHLWSTEKLVILRDIQNINFQKDIMKYMLAQIIFGKKEKTRTKSNEIKCIKHIP